MYTECPECSIGFRVTAKVLQQAGGRVRCGGCGHAFSALEHLTEEPPAADQVDDAPPQETDADDLTSDEKFRETSRQLLKTLNELAGPEEVRIEDTGIEWQVLDEEEGIAAEAAPTETAPPADAPTDVAATEEDIVAEDLPADESLKLEEASQAAANEEHHDDSLELADDDEEIATATDIEGIEEEIAPAEETLDEEDDDEEIAAGRSRPSMGSATHVRPVQEAPPTEEEWSDLLEVVTEDGADAEDIPLEVEEELAAIHSELSTKEEPEPVDLDSQFDMQAEAMGLEISGSHDIAEEEEGITVVASPEDDEAEEDAAEDDKDEVAADVTAAEDAPETDHSAEEDAALAAAYGVAEDIVEEDEDAPAEDAEEISAANESAEDKEKIAAAFTPDAEVIELSIEGSEDATAQKPEYTAADDVPEMSEEEMTINEQIDQELLAVADQDKDLTATIIGLENAEKMFEEEAAGVETIIMEGDVVRGAMEREAEKEKRERALKRFDKAGNLIDSYMARRAVRGGRRSTDPPAYGVIAAAVFLVLLLGSQVIHANRESLSTSGLFNQTVGQLYRMLGDPVTPEWSIKGWQFEATNGSVAENQDVLTIYSRIGNKSEQPLPYPLVHVSLTDRWEEIIGSAVLEPSEYLAGDLNPGQPVIPGENFTAVITIDEPSVDATGFKLNVCYRVSPGRVRCATEDFKD
jgi:predicted Zn finger-like uncharacterized protein